MSNIPNTTPVPNVLIDRYMRKLTDTAFKISMIIVRKTYGWILDPETGMRKKEDWIAYSQLMEFSGRERAAVSKALRELEDNRLIDIRDEKGRSLHGKEDRRGKKLYYRFVTSMESELVTPNQFGKRTSESEHTKETNTKTISKEIGGVAKKQLACPLLNGSPLREKYGNGHMECVEYLGDVQTQRKQDFINRSKQFSFLHKILRAGYGFDQMDAAIKGIERRFGPHAWDMATLASWLEKGGR